MASDLRRTLLHPKRSREISGHAPVTAIIHEPQRDWAPLLRAPYFCVSDGFITSAERWKRALQTEVQRPSLFRVGPLKADYPELIGASPPEWSFLSPKTEMLVWIEAMGITTAIHPGHVYVYAGGHIFDLDRWIIGGGSIAVLEDPTWDEISPDERIAAQWHRRLLDHLFCAWRSNFVRVARSGAAHIMARKNSVLAPFERVAWDQWQFFRLDECDDHPPVPMVWHDPRDWAARLPSTATGPTGERLYSIYVAPGLERNESLTAEQKCQQWLLGLMRDYSDRAPEPLGRLAEEAISRFPGLSKRGFGRCYLTARAETGNGNWSRPGAPSKSPQKSPHKK